MVSFGAVVRMVGRRSLGHWKLLLALVAGVFLASALMSSVFLYSDAIRDLGLSHALSSKAPTSLDVHVYTSTDRIVSTSYDPRHQKLDSLLAAQAADITSEVVHSGTSSTFYLTPVGGTVPVADNRPRAQLQFEDRLAEHTRMVEGKPSTNAVPPQPGQQPTVELMIGKAAADELGVKVGDQFDLHPTWRDGAPVLRATVTGIIEPTQPDERYWGGETNRFRFDTPGWPTYPFWLDESSLTKGLAATYPDMETTLEGVALVDTGSINSGNAKDVEGRLEALPGALKANVSDSRVESQLADTIKSYRDKLFFTRLPLFALMIQIVGIVLFYVVMVASMVIERQTGEIALLKSRGASTWQIVTVFAIEAFFICTAAVIIGPLIAVGAIAVLGLTPPFHDLSGGDLLNVPLSWGAVGMAAFGAYLAFLALIWPAWRACRYSITNYKQEISRPKTQPAFLRYYLDLVVIGVAALAFYQLRQHDDSLATKSIFGDRSTDPVLLATPALLILTVALVFLRLYPIALRLVAWLTRRVNGAAISVGLTHMVRSPVQHSRLILLLILTTAVGVFAAGFRATLEQGYQDRAAYQAGSEVHIQDIRKPTNLPLPQFNNTVASLTGSKSFTGTARVDATVNLAAFKYVNASILGVQPNFADFVFWRGDFAGESLHTLVKKLQLPEQQLPPAITVPPGSRSIAVWALLPFAQNAGAIGVRLVDQSGNTDDYRLVPAAPVTPGNWGLFVADISRPLIPRPGGVDLTSPRTVESLYIRMQGTPPMVPETDAVLFDDLQVSPSAPGVTPTGLAESTVIEPFDDLSHYELLTGVSSVGNPGELTRATASNGREGSVARLSFIRGRGGVPTVGLRRITDQRPLPIVVDNAFLSAAGKKKGDVFLTYVNSQYINVQIVGTFDLFPGYDPSKNEHLFLADLALLQDSASRAPSGIGSIYPNEAWLGDRGGGVLTKDGLAAAGLGAEAVDDRIEILAQQASDPLIAASWQGILFLSFSAVLVLSALGFVTYSGLSAQARSLEFAILRTMGMSGKQIIGVVSFEQCFVIVAGVVAGTLLGFPLSRLMIDAMGISEQGTSALPPLISKIGWQAIITVYTLLGVILAGTILALVLLYSRLAVSRALRMGEL